ncbi:MAG: hypothetical protein ACRDWW_04385, partial [Acidimicrobiales bacterium]
MSNADDPVAGDTVPEEGSRPHTAASARRTSPPGTVDRAMAPDPSSDQRDRRPSNHDDLFAGLNPA